MISQRAELPIVSFSVRVYQALLRAYPTKFQQEFGSQMVQVFRDCCLRTFHQGGMNGMVKLWTVTLLDLIQSVISEHAQKEIEMKKEMKPEDIRMAGGALIWGAVAFVIGFWLMSVRSPLWGISVVLITFLSMPLLIVGLLAVRNRYGEKIGRFGKNILLMGIILGPLMTLIGLFGVGDPGKLQGLRLIVMILFIIGPAVLFAGLTLFGFVAVYKRPLPRWNILPIIAGLPYTVIIFSYIITGWLTGDWEGGLGIPNGLIIIFIALQGIALAALGYILKSDVPEETIALA